MKKIIYLMLCCLPISYSGVAQTAKPIQEPGVQVVTLDDTHANSLKLARDFCSRQHAALARMNNLTAKQKQQIHRIEVARDKKFNAITAAMKANKERLETLKSVQNAEKKRLQLTANIAKLAVARQRLLAESTHRIKTKLTKSQRQVFENTK